MNFIGENIAHFCLICFSLIIDTLSILLYGYCSFALLVERNFMLMCLPSFLWTMEVFNPLSLESGLLKYNYFNSFSDVLEAWCMKLVQE